MIAVVGVGAVGGACAARLARKHTLVCCVRRRFDTLTLDAPDGVFRASPELETEPIRVRVSDWVLFCTKAHQTASAAPWLAHLVGDHTRVAVLQNGVEHVARLAPWVNEACIVPVVVDLPSSSAAPGQVVQRSPARLTVKDDASGRAFAGLFDGTGIECVLSDDLVSVAWQKLCSNVVGGALAALAGKALPELEHPGKHELGRRLARECAAVARAEGARLSDLEAETIADSLLSAAAGGAPSILQDRLRRAPLEWEARNGAVVRLGARHAIEAPLNARACELLAAAHREPTRDLLAELADHG